jgi:septum formation protein
MKKIILASTSKYRKELLTRLGHKFECISPNLDEDIFKSKIEDPILLAETLGKEKALAVLNQNHIENKHAVIIGSDQLAECEGVRLSKPKTMEKAIDQLIFLNGKSHRLITSYTVAYRDELLTKTNITTLTMRNLSIEQIKKYLICDIPFDCAGSYKLELNGISLFSQINTTDHSAIIGLPLISLGNTLNEIGVTTPPIA